MRLHRGRLGAAVPVVLFIALIVWPAAAHAAPSGSAPSAAPSPSFSPALCDPDGIAVHGSATTAAADLAAANQHWDVARATYHAVLASSSSTPQERGCAASGLDYIAAHSSTTPSPASDTSSAWDSFFADWVRPALSFGVPALVVFAVFLVLMRVATSWVCRPDSPGLRKYSWARRNLFFGAWLVGMLATAWAAVMLTIGLSLATGGKHTWALGWMQQVSELVLAATIATGVMVLTAVGRDRSQWWVAGPYAAGAVGLGIAGSIALTAAGVWRSAQAVAIVGALTALAGIALAARVRGLGLGLRINAAGTDGKDDNELAGNVRSRLYALAAQDPHGIQLTQQTDVSTLPDDAVSLLPSGALSKALTLVLKVFTAAEPWRIQLAERTDGALSVSVVRNGAIADSTVITAADASLRSLDPSVHADLQPLSADKTKQALRAAAAAFAMLTLSERHQHLKDGLVGATKWRSLAAQVIALDRDFELGPQGALALLADAVAVDSANLPAAAAYLNRAYRAGPGSTDATAAYLDGLEKMLAAWQDRPGTAALEMRLMFNFTAGNVNIALLHQPTDPDAALMAFLRAHCAMSELQRLMRTARDRSLDRFLDDLRPAAYWVHRGIDDALIARGVSVPGWCAGAAPSSTLTPLAQYERACYNAAGDPSAALDDLEIVLYQPGWRSGVSTDPSLDPLFHLDDPAMAKRFKALVGTSLAQTSLDLAPFAPRKDDLTARGFASAGSIIGTRVRTLRKEFGLSRLRALHWVDVAVLCEFVRVHSGPNPADDPAPTTDLLMKTGIETVTELRRRLSNGVDALGTTLAEQARTYDVLPPRSDAINQWAADLGA